MGQTTLTIRDARAMLGLHGPSDADTLTRAFRAAVMAARPDLPGGDADRFRRVIEAYRLIQQAGGHAPALAAPVIRPAAQPVIGVEIAMALNGGAIEVAAPDGRPLRVTVPAGLRTGDHIRLRGAGEGGVDLFMAVRLVGDDGLRAMGDDLHMTAAIEPRLLNDGGRVEIETHAGPRSAWLAPAGPQPARIRLKGLGLPARGARPCGHLFVTLTPGEDAPSAAEHLLQRFNHVWAAQRMAA
jgi:curved DNA-binding protein